MKITCDIIRDLLPLYAEDLVSEDSKQLVDEHLSSCDPCTKILVSLKKEVPVPVENDVETLNKVKKMILQRRIFSVLAALLTLVTLASFAITYLFAPFQLTMEQAIDDFYIREDQKIVINYSPYVIGRSVSGFNDNWFINQYSTRYDMWKGNNRKPIAELFGKDGIITEEERQRYENIDIFDGSGQWLSSDGKTVSDVPLPGDKGAERLIGNAEKNWWYSDPTGLGNDTLLYDSGKEMPAKEDRIQFAPAYPILFFGGIVSTVILLVLRKFMKKSWIKKASLEMSILCISAVFSTLFVSSGRIFTSYVGVIDQYWGWMIGINTILLTITTNCWNKIHLLNKQDRGE